MMKKTNVIKPKNKWKIAIFGMLILAGFLTVFGYLTDAYGEIVGWNFYALMAGSVLGVILILVGIYKAKKKHNPKHKKNKS